MKIILLCGSGASSGFMAASMRKEAKVRNLSYEIEAHSESEIQNYIDEVDCVMIGPHLAYLEEELREELRTQTKLFVMKHEYYARLDGKLALDHLESALNSMDEKEKL
ncbi:PTS sugar transporter subunit IIB [Amedibacillus sp. YH-ame6]